MQFGVTGAGSIEYIAPKLERGNAATDWTPAPEDTEAAIATAQATADAAAPKASAVKRTQRIWYRSNSATAPYTPGTASSNWVTKADDGNAAWTMMHVAISSTHKYVYTCEQYELASGTVGYTTVLRDNTITVIDGGNIITGSVSANKLDVYDATIQKIRADAIDTSSINILGATAGKNIKIDEDSIEICDGDDVKATIDENGLTVNGKMNFRDILYDNASGTNGTVTLSASAANYNHLRIHTKTSYGHGSVDVPNPNGKDVLLLSMATDNSGNTTMYFIQQSRYISGTSISVNHNGYAWMVSRSATSDNTGVGVANHMYITRVEAWNE